jgi:hypothetical protein
LNPDWNKSFFDDARTWDSNEPAPENVDKKLQNIQQKAFGYFQSSQWADSRQDRTRRQQYFGLAGKYRRG